LAIAQVNFPKKKRTFCKKCKKHMPHSVSQYKQGKASLFAQGKRRYDRKQSGFGGQTKPVFRKKVINNPLSSISFDFCLLLLLSILCIDSSRCSLFHLVILNLFLPNTPKLIVGLMTQSHFRT
jgi:ribosomal protein L44E